MSRSCLGISLILCATIATGGEPATAPPPRVIPIAALVNQLGSKDSVEREVATKRLSAIALDPLPELLAATKSADPEVRARALTVALAMRWNVAATRLPRGERFAEQGRIDLFVAATAVWDLKADDPRLWEPAADLGRRLIERANMKGDRKPHNCPSSFRDFATYKRLLDPRFTRMDAEYLCPDPQQENPPILYRNESIQAPGVFSPTGIYGGILVSRGPVESQYAIQSSVVLANGDVRAVSGMYSVVIVCDGDVNLTDRHITQAVVVARGNIIASRGADSSVLIAGGKVTLGEKLNTERQRFNVIKENTTDMLGITFFELSTVGVEVKATDGAVRVAKVADGKPFARADVKVGDVVTEVNGQKPATGESLRRLLRDALAIGDATLKVKRGDKTETVKIALSE